MLYSSFKECGVPELTREDIVRFENKYVRGGEDECWEFSSKTFSLRRPGVRRKTYTPYRISWEVANRQPIPDGKLVCHHCDNPACVNPKHLYAGTHVDNNNDTVNRGRATRVLGESCSWSKLTAEQVIAIRNSSARQVDLAAKYGVSQSHISRIKHSNRKLWAEVGGL